MASKLDLEARRRRRLRYQLKQKSGGRARLRMGEAAETPAGTVKLSPRARTSSLDSDAIPSIPFNLIEPFLNQAVDQMPANKTGCPGYKYLQPALHGR